MGRRSENFRWRFDFNFFLCMLSDMRRSSLDGFSLLCVTALADIVVISCVLVQAKTHTGAIAK